MKARWDTRIFRVFSSGKAKRKGAGIACPFPTAYAPAGLAFHSEKRNPIRMLALPRVVAFLAESPGDMMNLVAISSVLSYAEIDGRPAYRSLILSAGSGREIKGRDGLSLNNCIPYSEYHGPIDTLVIIGGDDPTEDPESGLLEWIRNRADQVNRIVSVCSGVFMLAATGMLDGRRATTHWHHSLRLTRKHPGISIERDQIFIKDGNLYSTAGATAGIDLALMLVEEDLGHKAAASIAHSLILYHRRPGHEAQHSKLLAQQASVSGTPLRDLPAWAKARLAEKLDVGILAEAAAMSPRTFARQFEQHFQTTPARWIQSLRIEAACVHIAARELPLKIIAQLTGFRDEQSLRRAFSQQLSMTPREYRDRFGVQRSAIAESA